MFELQRYFDTELSGKVINRLSRSITQITNFMRMMSNNFLQFIFSTIFSLIVVALYSWRVALVIFTFPIYIYMTFRMSNKWQKWQGEINTQSDIATGRFAESVGRWVKVVKSFARGSRSSFFNRHMGNIVKTTRPQSKYWHSKDVQRRLILKCNFLWCIQFYFY